MASAFNKVLHAFKKFPGIGQKMAERLTFYSLEMKKNDFDFLVKSLEEFRANTTHCRVCGLLSEQDPCRICSGSKRDRGIICVVKNVQDALMIERGSGYKGLYHVLGDLISPVNNVYEKDLNLNRLIKRVDDNVKEIIFAFEQNIEAEATIKTISNYLLPYKLKLTRFAVGIPMGTGLEFIDEDTLKKSLDNRTGIS